MANFTCQCLHGCSTTVEDIPEQAHLGLLCGVCQTMYDMGSEEHGPKPDTPEPVAETEPGILTEGDQLNTIVEEAVGKLIG